MRYAATIAMLALLFWAAPPAAAVTEENFQLRNGNDLVELCAVSADDPLRTAAIHMCHGFGAGAFQMIQALTKHDKMAQLFCPPSPTPSRNEAVAAFVVWARNHTDKLGYPPADVVGYYLVTTYPCPTSP